MKHRPSRQSGAAHGVGATFPVFDRLSAMLVPPHRWRTVGLTIVVIVLGSAASVATAAATTVETGYVDDGYKFGWDTATVRVADGARGRIAVGWSQNGWRFTDGDVAPSFPADALCERLTDGSGSAALCAADIVRIFGADQNDELRVSIGNEDDPSGKTIHLDGGAGDDSIIGGLEADRITWNAGNDTIDAGGDMPGAGEDTLITRLPATIDLATGKAHAGKLLTRLRSIESVSGVRARIKGNSRRNTILSSVAADGRGGADWLAGDGTLRGGSGDDWLTGVESLYGGAGDDELTMWPNHRDTSHRTNPRASCGPGTDLVIAAVHDLWIAPDCEWLAFTLSGLSPERVDPAPVRIRGGTLGLRVRCLPRERCRGTVRLSAQRRSGAAVRYRIAGGHAAVIRLATPANTAVDPGQTVALTYARSGGRRPYTWRTPAP